jgi:hypothetical protein
MVKVHEGLPPRPLPAADPANWRGAAPQRQPGSQIGDQADDPISRILRDVLGVFGN